MNILFEAFVSFIFYFFTCLSQTQG